MSRENVDPRELAIRITHPRDFANSACADGSSGDTSTIAARLSIGFTSD